MNVICSVNGEQWDGRTPLYVCHHCGMPVCEQHGWTVGADDAFDPSDTSGSRAAMHCPGCAEEYHRGAHRYHGWKDPKAEPAAVRATPAPGTAYGQQARARAR